MTRIGSNALLIAAFFTQPLIAANEAEELVLRKNEGLESEQAKVGSKQSDPNEKAIALCYDQIDPITPQPLSDPSCLRKASKEDRTPPPQSVWRSFSFGWAVISQIILNDLMDVDSNGKAVEDSILNTIFGELMVSWKDLGDVRLSLGTTKTVIKTSLSTLYSSGVFRNNRVLLNFPTTFSWDLGCDLNLFTWKNFYGTFSADYMAYNPKVDYVVDGATSVTHYVDIGAKFYSWNLALLGGYTFDLSPSFSFSPFFINNYGADYLNIDTYFLDLDGLTTIEIGDLVGPPVWGYTLGMTLSSGDKWGLTAQFSQLAYIGYTIAFNMGF